MSQKRAHLPQGFRTSWLDAKLDAMAYDRFGFRFFMIASALAATVWVGFVGSALLRPAPPPPPPKVAALPPLGLPALPPAADPSSLPGQTNDSMGSDTTPFGSDASRTDNGNAVVPPASTANAAATAPTARKASGSSGAAPKPVAAPAAKPMTITVRTFHPPTIPSAYKDMVADKMKEAGMDPRLEAKIRSGQQLSKGDLASIPRPIMEKINQQVVAYGQPPLYTDSTTTAVASTSH